MTKILAIDPGKNNGVAYLDTEAPDRAVRYISVVVGAEKLYEFLKTWDDPVDVLVIEDYVIRNKKSQGGFDHSWDKGYTLRIIGALQYWAWQNKVPVVLQQPWEKDAMYGKLGLKNITERYKFLTQKDVEISETSGKFAVALPLVIAEL